jgi:hypothetical protein
MAQPIASLNIHNSVCLSFVSEDRHGSPGSIVIVLDLPSAGLKNDKVFESDHRWCDSLQSN